MKTRCDWANSNELEKLYHDNEWGKPTYDDHKLFEFIILEGQQAGLSWDIILKRREKLREAYLDFNPHLLKDITDAELEKYLKDDRVIKNKLKIHAVRENAKAFLKIVDEFGSFSNYIWAYFNHQPIVNHWKNIKEVPATTPLSDLISKDLKKRGFKFIGSTIIYSFMQACGMVNDHVETCYLHQK
ncbi:DNA-3-methyladenine glycosylase I [Alteracholeplasma palmae J233]|uniref:DNA-3-methyladenine glycosylase I n=1 Tax=Alteracholeplasma palmae (strain ATCC 49389 / J233) TaxID=1318466 RepID=U4KK38_ALTPJ|nr:DNA-3-methyladenine glycosylase I [Alteracholeplasma palmae]CCV63994.1 DNA-3-methyladenine glycosylase I [Alteracholeplasma palmae J233]